jgi:hypothetical protein
MPASAPDSDPGFAGMIEWKIDTYFCGAVVIRRGGFSIPGPNVTFGRSWGREGSLIHES